MAHGALPKGNMLKQYKELLATLQAAKAQALAIQKKGGPTERVYRGLDQPISEVRRRVQFMEESAQREEAAAKKAAAPQLPDEPCPTPIPTPTEAVTPPNASKAGARGETRPPKDK
jgi:hypothetical protein